MKTLLIILPLLLLLAGTAQADVGQPAPYASRALKSATTVVDVAAAAAPTAGQVLKATASTTATWQTLVPEQARLTVVDASANDVLTAADVKTTFINSADVQYTLPLPATMTSGDWFEFIVGDSNAAHYFKILVDQTNTDTIRYLGTTTAADGYCRSNAIGSKVRVILNPLNTDEWLIVDLDGTWTYDS